MAFSRNAAVSGCSATLKLCGLSPRGPGKSRDIGARRIRRLSIGNPGAAKSVGGGVSDGSTMVPATAFISSVEAKRLSS